MSIQFFKKKLQNQRVKKLTYLPIVEARRPVPGLNGLKEVVSIQFFKKKLRNQRVKKLTYVPIIEVRRPIPGLNGLKNGRQRW